jgi:crotonobetainyl-CoA:carnitine CoA-transferase CaiB-like acyl-CoA transferase
VYISNWRPGVAEGLGLSDATLAELNPSLVRLSVTGFGRDGPLASAPAFDSLLQAHSGLTHDQAGGGRPQGIRALLADKTTALMAAQALLAALVARATSGRGELVDLAMLDVMAYFNFPELMQDLTFEQLEQPDEPDEEDEAAELAAFGAASPRRSSVIETEDGFLVVAPVSGAQIGRCLEAVGHPEWKAQLKALTNQKELQDTMLDLVESVTRGGTTAHWLARFAEHDVPAAAVLDARAHLADSQVRHNDIYSMADHPHLGRMREVRYPARFGGVAHRSTRRPAPMPGEHTEEVLGELGRLGGSDRSRVSLPD